MFVTVTSTEKFENVDPATVYNLHLNADLVAQITGAPATGGTNVGDNYTGYGGYCHGKNLCLVPGELIVQTWQGTGFVDQDSILVLRLEAAGEHTYMHMTHCNVTPEQSLDMAAQWRAYYWDKYRAHLAGKPIPATPAM